MTSTRPGWPEPYTNTDTPPDPDNLGGLLANAAHGIKADPLLDSLRAAIEGRPEPDSLAAVEDEFKADMEATPDSLAVRIGRGDWGTPTTTTSN